MHCVLASIVTDVVQIAMRLSLTAVDHMMMGGNRGQPQAFNNRNIQPNAALAPSQPVIDSPTTFSSDVEDEANSYFQKIYNQPPNNFGIDDVLKMLKQFKDSNIKHERVRCSCTFLPISLAAL